MEPLPLQHLTITQEYIHTEDQIPLMCEHVQNGGLFTQELLQEFADIKGLPKPSGLIKITEFPDEELYLQDGHHRCLAIFLGGRTHLDPSEYKIEHWTYEEYQNINFRNKWVTPYDPRIQVRKADFKEFKEHALKIAAHDLEVATDFIRLSASLYSLPRNVYSIQDLVRRYYANSRSQAKILGV